MPFVPANATLAMDVQARGLRQGHDITGNAIENPPDRAYGAVVNPNFEPLDLQKMKAAEMMGRFLAEIKHMVQGVHLMPLGWADIVPKILQTARIAI